VKILVLGGGDSPEREVSLRSAKSVANAALEAGYEVIEADPSLEFQALDGLSPDTIIFPILHGKNGEDGVIQKDLELRKLPYLGSDSRTSASCFDKWQTRLQLKKNWIPMPEAVLVSRDTYHSQALAKKPHVLKVLNGGSTIGILIARKPDKVSDKQIDEVFNIESNAVLEELIVGNEITVPILDQKALPVVEIVPPDNEEFDYDNKYNGRSQELCPPLSVPRETQKQAQELAEKVHKTMGCRHLSRVDIMIDKAGKLYVLEINTMPGMTDQSLYPKSALVAGMMMPDLMTKFVELVKRDYSI
jgi:D-alanine-D-alanine ligase